MQEMNQEREEWRRRQRPSKQTNHALDPKNYPIRLSGVG